MASRHTKLPRPGTILRILKISKALSHGGRVSDSVLQHPPFLFPAALFERFLSVLESGDGCLYLSSQIMESSSPPVCVQPVLRVELALESHQSFPVWYSSC